MNNWGLNGAFFQHNLGVRKVAGGIKAKPITGGRLGPRAQVAVTDIEEAAIPAAFRQERLTIPQNAESRIFRSRPDLAKGHLADVAALVVPAKLVIVYVARRIDCRDIAAGPVTTGAAKPGFRRTEQFGTGFLEADQEIGRVGRVIDRQDFERISAVVHGPRSLKDLVDEVSRFLGCEIHFLHAIAASCVCEVVNAETLDVVLQAKVEYLIEIVSVQPVNRESHSHSDPMFTATVYSGDSACECSSHPTEHVMFLTNGIKADAGVLQTETSQPSSHRVIDKHSVGRKRAGKSD